MCVRLYNITSTLRDVSFPSVDSFNSVIPPPQSFIIVTSASVLRLRTIKCCSVVFGVTLRLLVINTSLSSPIINKLHRLPTTSVINHGLSQMSELHSLLQVLTACNGARYWLRIAISTYPTCIQHSRSVGFCQNSAITFGKDILKICLFVSTEYANVTDRWTLHDNHACIASHGKNCYKI